MAAFNRLLIIAVCVTAGIFVQIFLSKRPSRWQGLVLPVLMGLFSLVYVMDMIRISHVSLAHALFGAVSTLVEMNIPTFAFYIIYRNYHKPKKNKKKFR